MPDQNSTPKRQNANLERDPFEKVLLQAAVLKKLNAIHRDFKAEATATGPLGRKARG
ncbi:hypothetical protein [Corynebacterium lizhenjunii]|uniref:hypothetical protein n=1 Tax=Corynebacterium lizhenjunii TaxID=2709394 RepID=UPI0013EB0CDE|nr:hypothetical protein [Corynebacterium lizhenjunii]